MSVEQVWSEEPGVMIKFERVGNNSQIKITFLKENGGEIITSARISGWRWDRCVAAMKLTDVPKGLPNLDPTGGKVLTTSDLLETERGK